MNEQDKREIMLEIATRYNGEWPDFATHIWLMPSGSEVFGHIDNDYLFDKETILCSKSEYEAFIDSLFEGAPDDAEFYLHRESGYVFWKSVAGGYLRWNKATQEWDDQVCSLSQVESELIKRPCNQEKSEWSGEGLPPVGAKCEIQTDDLSDFYQVTIQAYSSDGKVVLIYDDLDDNCEYDYWFIDDTIFRPLKTEPKNWTPKAGEPCEFDVGGGDWVYALPLFVGKTIIVFENDHGDECKATSVDRFRLVQPEPKPWMPEVGQECEIFTTGAKWIYAKIKFIGDEVVVFYDDGGNERTAYATEPFRPLKTEAEKEFDALMSRIADDFGHLYDIDVIGDFATDLILAGWRPRTDK